MAICYEIVCSEKQIEDVGLCCVYGLTAYEQEDRLGNLCCRIEDISINKSFVEELCNLIRHHEVHPIHLMDVVLDAIG